MIDDAGNAEGPCQFATATLHFDDTYENALVLFGFSAHERPHLRTIKQRYNQLARLTHPDTHHHTCSLQDEQHAENVRLAFYALNQAMHVLLPDDQARRDFREMMASAAEINQQLFDVHVRLFVNGERLIAAEQEKSRLLQNLVRTRTWGVEVLKAEHKIFSNRLESIEATSIYYDLIDEDNYEQQTYWNLLLRAQIECPNSFKPDNEHAEFIRLETSEQPTISLIVLCSRIPATVKQFMLEGNRNLDPNQTVYRNRMTHPVGTPLEKLQFCSDVLKIMQVHPELASTLLADPVFRDLFQESNHHFLLRACCALLLTQHDCAVTDSRLAMMQAAYQQADALDPLLEQFAQPIRSDETSLEGTRCVTEALDEVTGLHDNLDDCLNNSTPSLATLIERLPQLAGFITVAEDALTISVNDRKEPTAFTVTLLINDQTVSYDSTDFSLLWPLIRYFEVIARTCFTHKYLQTLIAQDGLYQTLFVTLLTEPPYQALRVFLANRDAILKSPMYRITEHRIMEQLQTTLNAHTLTDPILLETLTEACYQHYQRGLTAAIQSPKANQPLLPLIKQAHAQVIALYPKVTGEVRIYLSDMLAQFYELLELGFAHAPPPDYFTWLRAQEKTFFGDPLKETCYQQSYYLQLISFSILLLELGKILYTKELILFDILLTGGIGLFNGAITLWRKQQDLHRLSDCVVKLWETQPNLNLPTADRTNPLESIATAQI